MDSGYLLPEFYPTRNDRRCHKCRRGERLKSIYAYFDPTAPVPSRREDEGEVDTPT
jgi:hypothetical protein